MFSFLLAGISQLFVHLHSGEEVFVFFGVDKFKVSIILALDKHILILKEYLIQVHRVPLNHIVIVHHSNHVISIHIVSRLVHLC